MKPNTLKQVEYWDAVEILARLIAKYAKNPPTLEQLAVPSYFDEYLSKRANKHLWNDVAEKVFGFNMDLAPEKWIIKVDGKKQKVLIQPTHEYAFLYNFSLKIRCNAPILVPNHILETLFQHCEYNFNAIPFEAWKPSDQNYSFIDKTFKVLSLPYDNNEWYELLLENGFLIYNKIPWSPTAYADFSAFGKCRFGIDPNKLLGSFLYNDLGELELKFLSSKNEKVTAKLFSYKNSMNHFYGYISSELNTYTGLLLLIEQNSNDGEITGLRDNQLFKLLSDKIVFNTNMYPRYLQDKLENTSYKRRIRENIDDDIL